MRKRAARSPRGRGGAAVAPHPPDSDLFSISRDSHLITPSGDKVARRVYLRLEPQIGRTISLKNGSFLEFFPFEMG
ncbi:hypothetical protein EVAR_71188_1, partial [Eumeta japonica]